MFLVLSIPGLRFGNLRVHMHGGLLVTSEGVHSFTFLRRHGTWAINCWGLEVGGRPLKIVSDMSNAKLEKAKICPPTKRWRIQGQRPEDWSGTIMMQFVWSNDMQVMHRLAKSQFLCCRTLSSAGCQPPFQRWKDHWLLYLQVAAKAG